MRRQSRIQLDGRRRYLVQNCFKDNGRGRSRERLLAGGHFVKHHTERKKISALVQCLAACLLGGHITDGAHCRSRSGELIGTDGSWRPHSSGRSVHGVAPLRGEFRQAKIKDLSLTSLGDKDIRRLDVAVHNSA